MAASEAPEFSIYVKTLTGANAEVRVRSTDSVASLRSSIEAKLKLTLPIVRLVHDGKELDEDGKTLNDYEVGKEAIVVVVLESNKPCHFFFALDESGSMSGRRWAELIRSFKDFVTTRHEEAAKTGEKLTDLVSVFFHETHCRVADYFDAAGQRRPFDSVPLADVTPDSLANEFRSGGNNFDHVLAFLEPFLDKCTDYTPVLMFMTDGGDCGDDAPPCADFRQRAYDRMAAIKKRLPELRLYVTVVYTTSRDDIEGAKRLCLAGGSDIETFFTYLEDEGQPVDTYSHLDDDDDDDCGAYLDECEEVCTAECDDDDADIPAAPRRSRAKPTTVRAPAPSSSPAVATHAKMAKQWTHAYKCNSSFRPK